MYLRCIYLAFIWIIHNTSFVFTLKEVALPKFDPNSIDFSLSTTVTFKVPDTLKVFFSEYCEAMSLSVSSELNRYMLNCIRLNQLNGVGASVPPGELVVFTFRSSRDVKERFALLCKQSHISVSSALRKEMAYIYSIKHR